MLDPHRELQALVDRFVADLRELATRIAIDQIEHAFGATPAPRASKPAAPVARGKRGRRGPQELLDLRERLLGVIADNPGRRTEELNAALGTTTAQIGRLLRELVADKRIRTEGARRGMRYFAARGVVEPIAHHDEPADEATLVQ
jgi:hypothetical protein